MLRVYIETGKVTDAVEYEVHSDRMTQFGAEVRLTKDQAAKIVEGLCKQAGLLVVSDEPVLPPSVTDTGERPTSTSPGKTKGKRT